MPIVTVPIRTPLFAGAGKLLRPWMLFFESLANPGPERTGRGILADLPDDLELSDDGFLYEATDFGHIYRWRAVGGVVDTDGTTVTWVSGDKFIKAMVGKTITIDGTDYVVASYVDDEEIELTLTGAGTLSEVQYSAMWWEYAPGETESRTVVAFLDEPTQVGWRLCNGNGTDTVTVSNSDGTTSVMVVPQMATAYLKGGSAYSGTVAAAVPANITGETGLEDEHTHDGSGLTVDASTSTTSVNTTDSDSDVASDGHSHNIIGTTGPGSAHKHTRGTLVNDDIGEPKHVTVPFYMRL